MTTDAEFLSGMMYGNDGGVPRDQGKNGPLLDPDSVGFTRALADTITAEEHFARDAGGKLWHYSDGVYRQHGERAIKVKVKTLLEEWAESKKWNTNRANEVVEYIRVDAPELWDKPPDNLVNVQNGILDLGNGELLVHTPTFLSPVQLPVSYDPEATCPGWERFVSEVFPEDARNLAWEMVGWLITPDTSIQKAILLLGEGANGKSTFLRAVENLIGRRNTANLPMQKIEADRFAAARLVGKLANICPDLPSQHLASTSTFKAITGGDPINAEYKYHDSFDVVPYARLVFSANHPPRSGDASHAFYRRWVVIPFDRTFEPNEQRTSRDLDAELADPRELSGVLNKAIPAWRDLKSRGFTETESMRRALEEFRDTTDPLSVWLDRNTTEHADAAVSKDVLRRAYAGYCEEKGIPRPSNKALDGAVRRAKRHLGESQRIYNGVPNTRVWVGLGLMRDPEQDNERGLG